MGIFSDDYETPEERMRKAYERERYGYEESSLSERLRQLEKERDELKRNKIEVTYHVDEITYEVAEEGNYPFPLPVACFDINATYTHINGRRVTGLFDTVSVVINCKPEATIENAIKTKEINECIKIQRRFKREYEKKYERGDNR